MTTTSIQPERLFGHSERMNATGMNATGMNATGMNATGWKEIQVGHGTHASVGTE